MVSKSVLNSAKAFLCWEAFESLSIQLVGIQDAVAYYYPTRNSYQSIVLFYHVASKDFSEPLFLLFHEAGHAKQWGKLHEEKREALFHKMVDLDRGTQKVNFEREAWHIGRRLFSDFIQREKLNMDLLNHFDHYSTVCLKSYGVV